MSKKKNNKPYNDNIEQEVISVEQEEKVAEIENIEEEFDASEPETEEVEKETTDYPFCDEKVEVKAENKTNVSNFIARKLKVINELSDEGKVNAYAQRVLRNK